MSEQTESQRLADLLTNSNHRLTHGDCDEASAELRHLERVVQALTARVAAAEKDAGRYRWLLQSEYQRIDPLRHLPWKPNQDRNGSIWVNTANLDAAIDAAMEGAKA